MLAFFSVLSASWAHFSRLAAFVAAFGRFFRDLGRSSLDFGAPSWPYVGTYFALGGIFRHAAGITAKKTCWNSLSVFRFHNEARRYVRSTWNWSQVGSKLLPYLKALPFLIPLELNVFWRLRLGGLWARFWCPQASILKGLGSIFLIFSHDFGRVCRENAIEICT